MQKLIKYASEYVFVILVIVIRNIPYTHKKSMRARSMRISVGIDGRVVVTSPHFASESVIEKFVTKHIGWISGHVARANLRNVVRIPRKDIVVLKQKALAFAEDRCAYVAKIYGLSYKKIFIRAQRSRWGSCSVKGNLSFNYKIAVLPSGLAEYIVVHEICHLAQMNHSKRFWELVKKIVPNCMELRKELRKLRMIIE